MRQYTTSCVLNRRLCSVVSPFPVATAAKAARALAPLVSSPTATTTAKVLGRRGLRNSVIAVPPRSHSQSYPGSIPPSIQLSLESDALAIQFSPTERVVHRFPYTWLRDSDPQLVHSATRQKLHSSSQVPLDVGELPLKAELTEDGTRVKIVWGRMEAHTRTRMTVDHGMGNTKEWPNETEFSVEMLRRYSHLTLEDAFRHAIKPFPWTQKELVRSDDLTMSYDSLCISKDDDDAVVRRGIEQLLKYGILFVEGIPSEETSDERCETGKLARIFGIVRETIYGRLWDVVSRGETSRNIAYTNLDLGLHMDLAYCENPPRYQVLHMLRNTGVVGGESIFSDGYHAAYTLLEEDREAFDVLCQRPVAFQYMNEHHHLYREHRTIQLASSSIIPSNSPLVASYSDTQPQEQLLPLSVVVPEVAYINYSPPFQAPLPLHTNLDSRFLPALKKFTKLLHTDDRLYERAMKPGMAVIFDNRRVLHGRREFQSQSQSRNRSRNRNRNRNRNGAGGNEESSASGSSEGNGSVVEEELGVQRWLKGCYLEGDVLLDRLRVIRDGRVLGGARGYV